MKKMLKRIIAIVAMLCLFATQFTVFAAESANGVTEFTNGTEYEYNLYDLNMKYWYVNSNGATLTSNYGTSTSAIAIFKLPLPKLTNGQKITSYKFSFPETYLKKDSTSYWRAVKLEGSTAEWDKKLNQSLTLKDPAIAQTMTAANNEGWAKYNVSESITGANIGEGTNYVITVDVSSYANERYLSEDSDHFYVGIYSKWTAIVGWNQSSISDIERPRAYVTAGEAEELAFSNTNIRNRQLDVTTDTPVSFFYNRPIASASATVNGLDTACTVQRGNVTVNVPLEQFKDYQVALKVTDYAGASQENNLSFSTYYGARMTENPYKVGASSTTVLSSGYASVSSGGLVIYKLPFPQLNPGEKIGKYIFRHIPAGNSPSLYGRYVRIPWCEITNTSDDIPDISSLTLSSDAIKPVIGLTTAKAPAQYQVDDSVESWNTGYVPRYGNVIAQETNVDLTSYANECYDAGQKEYFLVGYNNLYTAEAYPSTHSGLANEGYYNGYYYSIEKADDITLTTDLNEKIQSSSPANFTFNNAIRQATATVNGKTVSCLSNGTNVTLDMELEQYTDYAVEMNLTDVYQQQKTIKFSFSTGAYYEYDNLKTDFSITFLDENGVASVQTSSHVTRSMKKTAVVAVKIPNIEYDEELKSYIFTFATNGNNDVIPYALPGDKWDVSKMNFATVEPYILTSTGGVSLDASPEVTNLGNSNYKEHIEIGAYLNECKNKGQTYAYFALATNSTVRAYGPSYSGASQKPYYGYSVSKKSIAASIVKIVTSDSAVVYDEAVHHDVLDKSASFKAVAKITNNTSSSAEVVVAIAEYVDEEAVSVAFTTVTVPANAKNFDAVSEAINLSGVSGEAKAFVWVKADNEPLVLNSLASIN